MYRLLRLPTLVLTLLLAQGCTPTQWLTGTYATTEDLTRALAWKHPVAQNYRPDPETLAEFAAVDSFEAVVLLSSWCHDSEREVPRFLALAPKLPLRVREYVLLDTTRTVPAGYKAQYGVRATPTFVFFRDGRELGRIVERPTGRLEAHILQLVRP